MLHINSAWISAIIGVFLPFVTALVTKGKFSKTVRGVFLAILSGIGAVVLQVSSNGGDFHWNTDVGNFLLIFLVAAVSYDKVTSPAVDAVSAKVSSGPVSVTPTDSETITLKS